MKSIKSPRSEYLLERALPRNRTQRLSTSNALYIWGRGAFFRSTRRGGERSWGKGGRGRDERVNEGTHTDSNGRATTADDARLGFALPACIRNTKIDPTFDHRSIWIDAHTRVELVAESPGFEVDCIDRSFRSVLSVALDASSLSHRLHIHPHSHTPNRRAASHGSGGSSSFSHRRQGAAATTSAGACCGGGSAVAGTAVGPGLTAAAGV